MSSTLRESYTGSGKTENASIRKYLTPSKPSTTTQTKKPLTSPCDNIVSKTTKSTTTTTTTTNTILARPNIPSLKRSKSTSAAIATATASTSTTTTTTTATATASSNSNINKSSDAKRKPLTQSLNSLPSYFFTQKRQRTSTEAQHNKETTKIGTLKRSHSAISHLDAANENWLKRPLLPHSKTTDAVQVGDRSLPQVKDMASAQVRVAVTNTQESPIDCNDGRGLQTHNELIAAACGYVPHKRILAFKESVPEKTKEDTSKNQPDYKINTTTAPSIKRRILASAEKVLDAPYMTDDYYLNVLDWSKENIVAIGLAKSVYLWNADDGSVHNLNYRTDDLVSSVAWSLDGAYLTVGTSTGQTQIWDVESNTKMRTMTGQGCRIGVVAWDKHIVTSGAQDGSIWLHDVRIANHKVAELNGHTQDVCGLKWRWDGNLLASGGNDSTVNIWDPRAPSAAKYTKRAHTGAIKALAWCPWNHNLLATGGGRDDKNIFFWNTATGSRVNTIATGSQVTSLHWSKHYKEIVSTHGYPHNQLTIWAYPSLNKIIDIPAHDQRILHSALSPDGQVLATAAADENLKFWRIFEHHGKQTLHPVGTSTTTKVQATLKRGSSIR